MKKLGLVGGTGPESTVLYYRNIIRGVGDVLGRETLPKVSIDSLSAFEVFSYCRAGRYDELAGYLLESFKNLAASGAEVAALTGSTPHIVFDRLRSSSPVPLVSAIDVTRDEAQTRGLSKVGLLGTEFTMRSGFFTKALIDAGIHAVVPLPSEIAFVHEKISSELEHGVVTSETREAFISIIETMRKRDGIEQVILGCTELPLILNNAVSPLPCLDTAELHIHALIKEIIGD
ncbi:aspartate/glutamate racemase family protein [Paenarthrobacter sp. NPDC089714]|uniref:aspartate/glutamate racemase family protein n=1 Tax=Paenarthrobacter sp. NPDC089714 TaxID=3364377 RepID=UPI00382E29CB